MSATLDCEQVRGMAAAYVLGALDAEDRAAVEAHLRTCEQPHPEFTELAAILPGLRETVPMIEPPKRLRDRVIAAAAADLAGRSPAVQNGIPDPEPDHERRPAPAHSPWRVRVRVIALAFLGISAILAIVGLGVQDLALQRDASRARDYQAHLDAVLAFSAPPGARVASLISTAGADAGPHGILVVQPALGMRILVSDAPPTSGVSVYQVWLTVPGAAPVPIGSFHVGDDGIGYLEQPIVTNTGPLLVIVTLEPQQNPAAPTSPVLASATLPAATP